jgi:23S rRNA U2552 (ribose-2'-O)-methylase RlmE/FtsJ
VGKVLLPKSLQFHPKKYDSVLNIFFADGFHYVSLVDKSEALGCGDHLYSNTENVWVSKAAAKIREALARLDRLVPKKSDLSGKTAIDVGASPGGWSYFLKSDRKCARVIAVDMGLLAEPIPHGVEHWKMKGNEAIDKLLSESSGFLHLYACDMNCDPIDSVQLFLRALVLLAPESLAVITLKRTERNKERWQKIKSECQKMLKESDRVKSVIEVHLVANTPNETTLLIDLH